MSGGKGLFITGTDTGVGKTVITALLARMLRDQGIRVGVMKPVTSGCIVENGRLISEDAELLKRASGTHAPDCDVAPYLLAAPIAPSAAAAQEGVRICFSTIRSAYERLAATHDLVLVEGAGGLMVPLVDNLMISDLIECLSLPVLVVSRPNLGTVNHTLMTCLCAGHLGLEVRGIIVNNYPPDPGSAEKYAPSMIEELSGIPVLAVFPHSEETDPARVVERVYREVGSDPILCDRLVNLAK